MALSEDEKVKVRHHLGFLGVGEIFTFVLGTPAGLETQFIVEGAMQRLLLATEPLVRLTLCRLDELDELRQEAARNALVAKVGSIEMREQAMKMIDDQLAEQRGALANAFGVYRNPFDKRSRGINLSVSNGPAAGGNSYVPMNSVGRR